MPSLVSQSNDTDQELGQRVKARRKSLGLTQSHLAAQLGVTFQQVQKYEKGTNRISVSTAIPLCRALNWRVADLVGDLDQTR